MNVDRVAFDDATETVRLGGELGTEHVAVNRYRIEPGGGFPGGLHAHADQEEVFVVVAGAARFETLEGGVRVEAGEAVRFAPGEYQSGSNAGDGDLVALALGAPRDSDDVRVPVTCPDCGDDGLRLDTEGNDPRFSCLDCGSEHTPAPCPDCGSDDLGFATDDENDPIVACEDCGSVFADAPLDG
ncbi:cupin domain-containing protein [Halobaculum sp. CBA1158]|uniref:cupin domain-containing protein n=1 Tax=Halobaculum sp. CBA1158 TaxID=2904243 RepID=UPI001F3A44B8|nr:cupin domain-containing protein [Halobaculum sp. CBA1158]UIO98722.1 cupin domain-containing protein [Halobaculum sp. CBA1158]